MKNGKRRLDILLTERGLFPSREAARRAIMAGLVHRDGLVFDKPGMQVLDTDEFVVTRPVHPYVGRGGLKLEKALKVFDVDLTGVVVLDVGASTGGFTDCALQHHARLVYAVDVGYGQLAWTLRNDERVIVMERTNFRHVSPSLFEPKPSVAVMDVSFISTRLLLPGIKEALTSPGIVVSLVKPQFEAGKERVGKGGIVRDPDVHLDVLVGLIRYVKELGFACTGLNYSPIRGGDGNIEYLARWDLGLDHRCADESAWADRAATVVRSAWAELQAANHR